MIQAYEGSCRLARIVGDTGQWSADSRYSCQASTGTTESNVESHIDETHAHRSRLDIVDELVEKLRNLLTSGEPPNEAG